MQLNVYMAVAMAEILGTHTNEELDGFRAYAKKYGIDLMNLNPDGSDLRILMDWDKSQS